MNVADEWPLRVRAANTVDHTQSLASQDPAWGSEVRSLAGGWLVLAGAGMYINQAMAAGIDDELSSADLDLLVARSNVAGVTPAIEVTQATLPESVRRVRERGFAHDSNSDITCLTQSVTATTRHRPPDVVIRPVETEADLRLWQETSATGWGHTLTNARHRVGRICRRSQCPRQRVHGPRIRPRRRASRRVRHHDSARRRRHARRDVHHPVPASARSTSSIAPLPAHPSRPHRV